MKRKREVWSPTSRIYRIPGFGAVEWGWVKTRHSKFETHNEPLLRYSYLQPQATRNFGQRYTQAVIKNLENVLQPVGQAGRLLRRGNPEY
jgi:hypothetical protein